MKYTLLVLVFLSSFAFADCEQFTPYGQPTVQTNTTIICRSGYVLDYDLAAKIPKWTAYTTDSKNSTGCAERESSFKPDTSLSPYSQSRIVDYAKSGYDIGHMVPASDMAYSKTTESESFIFSNTSPQVPSLNRGIWKNLETKVKEWAVIREHTLLIYSGNIYTSNSKRIGPDNVVVPDKLWKIIVDTETDETLAYIFTQNNLPSLLPAETSIANIEALTGLRIPVGTANKGAVNHAWDADYTAYHKTKKTSCQL